MTRPTITLPLAAAAAVLVASSSEILADPYFRAGAAWDRSASTDFSDADCAASSPAALFGCALGDDGLPIGARGNFGSAFSLEAGAGYRVLPALRVETLFSYRTGYEFSGNANFLGTPQPQPVSGDLESLSGMAVAYLDLAEFLAPLPGSVAPFVGAGLGVTRHSLSSVTYSFPGLGEGASTIVPGGKSTEFSYLLTAGAAVPISETVTLDLAYRFLDLGDVSTASGPAEIRRAGTASIDVAPTEAALRSHGVSASFRVGF